MEKSLSFVQVISLLGSGATHAVPHFCLHSVSYNLCIQGCCGVEKARYVAAPKIPLKLLSLSVLKSAGVLVIEFDYIGGV